MTFLIKRWDSFCRALAEAGRISIPASEVTADTTDFLVLKHDVETSVGKAFRMAEVEYRYGHRGSYYVQAYLLKESKNVALLSKMQRMGHEITYHHDVMDACHGDLARATEEFEANRMLFENAGFSVETVCQHGNPIVERVGYTSNRDFFRSEAVRAAYPQITDIMVNFGEARGVAFAYYSDAGRRFQLIYDPLTNDLVDSSDKNVPYETLTALCEAIAEGKCIVSTHPHRWERSGLAARLRGAIFKCIRAVARLVAKIPFMKRFMSRYYHLAKKL